MKQSPVKLPSAWSNSTMTTAASSRQESDCSENEEQSPVLWAIHRGKTAPLDEVQSPRQLPPRRSKTVPLQQLPQFNAEYPSNLVVFNTFLDFDEDATLMQDPRQTKSAPSSPLSRCSHGASDIFASEHSDETAGRPAGFLQLASMIAEPHVRDGPSISHTQTLVNVYHPHLGSPEMPTAGSAGHFEGSCKPCAFYWKSAGCESGVDCEYCHLCGQSEKKRRQKEKKQYLKERNQRVPATPSIPKGEFPERQVQLCTGQHTSAQYAEVFRLGHSLDLARMI